MKIQEKYRRFSFVFGVAFFVLTLGECRRQFAVHEAKRNVVLSKESAHRKKVDLSDSHFEEGVTIAVLDSGIYPRKEFNGRIIEFKDFVHQEESPYDDNGHGTAVAGLLVENGKATFVRLLVLKVLDMSNKTTLARLKEALRWVKENHRKYKIQIVNLSLALEKDEGRQIEQILSDLEESGVQSILSLGNEEKFHVFQNKHLIQVGSREQVGKNALMKQADVLFEGKEIEVLTSDMYYQKGDKISSTEKTVQSGTSYSTAIASFSFASLRSEYSEMPLKDLRELFLKKEKKKEG